jgi:acetylcholinesterase
MYLLLTIITIIICLSTSITNSHQYSPHRHHNKKTRNLPIESINSNNNNDDDLLVYTQSGPIRGIPLYAQHNNQEQIRLNGWLGIPYAEKPIDNLRFKRPVAKAEWTDVYNATKQPNSCYQVRDTLFEGFWGSEMWNPNTNISEDCLYLNVWSPHPRPKNAAVMVWIYGGGFMSGTVTLNVYDPRTLVSETNVIFVSMQYRLGMFGFFYMDSEEAPGNQGLLDQNLALKWVQNNIQYFGGDSNRITIFGESAGSVSVSLHLLSPLSMNLFSRAILQSGTSLADWPLLKHSEAMRRSKDALIGLGCPYDEQNKTVSFECLSKINSETIIDKADENFYSKAIYGIGHWNFLPIVDNYFLEEEPLSAVSRGKFKKCPILLGANKDEANWFFMYAFSEFQNFSHTPQVDYKQFKHYLQQLFYFYPQFPFVNSEIILQSIIHRYTNWNNVNDSNLNRGALDDAAGDFLFVCPTLDFANQYAIYDQKVYFYYYNHRSSLHLWPNWTGVCHADEISFVFGEPLNLSLPFKYEERVFSRKLLKYWSNFAKYADPNGPMDDISTQTLRTSVETWPLYEIVQNTDQGKKYLSLNANEISVGTNFRADYCAFWGNYLSEVSIHEGNHA